MPFCTSCGKQIEEDSLFCEHCGARQEGPAPGGEAPAAPPRDQPAPPPARPDQPAQTDQTTPPPAPPPGYGGTQSPGTPRPPRKPIPKGAKIAVLAVVILAVLAALFVFIMGKVNDPRKTIAAFAESILAEDYEQFCKVTCSADSELELTQESVEPFLALYSDRIDLVEEYQDSLAEDLEQMERGRTPTGNGLIRLVARDHVLFKSYQVEISGTPITFCAPLDGVQVSVGGQTVELEQAEQEYQVTLLPGRYDVEASCTNRVLEETFTTQLEDCELTASNSFWYISMDYTTICLEDIGLEVSSLLVNGKDYGPVEFDTWGEMQLCPLPADVTVEVSYDVEGFTFHDSRTWSEYYTWDSYYPQPGVSEEEGRVMLDQAGELLRGMIDAYNSGDREALAATLQYSRVVEDFVSELEDGQNVDNYYRQVYHYTVRELTGDLDWSSEGYYDGLNFSTLVYMGLDYTSEIYWDGELETGEDAGGTGQADLMMRIYMYPQDGQWVVQDLFWAGAYTKDEMTNPYTMGG